MKGAGFILLGRRPHSWPFQDGYTRPDGFDGRLSLAEELREKGNEKFKEENLDAAMMYALSALHCLDFSRGASMSHKDSHKQQTFGALVKIISNLSIVFLKRGDNYNAVRAADLGLDPRGSRHFADPWKKHGLAKICWDASDRGEDRRSRQEEKHEEAEHEQEQEGEDEEEKRGGS
ncbi:unnamed protein product [Prorocentrum cordatum]|uniref:KIF-binding protein n=1 Tax=Prorocentrum cordatum TaxID=2364126 RepID=A0ABN9SNY6_9DINO|nr:unnamed protein product [Polarella glacialis]